MLEIVNLKKKFQKKEVLKGIDLRVEEGALFGLVGPNGAGKTTLLRSICGLVNTDGGNIYIDSIDADAHRIEANRVIGYLPDSFGNFPGMPVFEYMIFFADAFHLYGLTGRQRCEKLLDLVGLSDRRNDLVDELSRGLQQKLSLARALIHEPKILIMDEPTNGLDPRARFEFKQITSQLCESGMTIIVSSHILTELSQMCTDIGILEKGKIVLSGSIDEVMGYIKASNPLRIRVLNGASDAMCILRENRYVDNILLDGDEITVKFTGGSLLESQLLAELIQNDIAVLEFARVPNNLESVFIRITEHNEERVIMSSDEESHTS